MSVTRAPAERTIPPRSLTAPVMPRLTNIRAEVQAHADGGAGRVFLSWTDAAGAARRESYYGVFAEQFAIDLAAATLIGEEARHVYLVGRIREVERLSG